MLQIGGPILYFSLLVLGIPLDLGPDASHKRVGFFKALAEKSLGFVPSRRDGTVIFNLGLVLLPAEVDLVPEERGREGDTLVARGSGRVEIVPTLSTEVVALHVQAPIVQVGVPGLEGSFSSNGVRSAMLLTSNKRF